MFEQDESSHLANLGANPVSTTGLIRINQRTAASRMSSFGKAVAFGALGSGCKEEGLWIMVDCPSRRLITWLASLGVAAAEERLREDMITEGSTIHTQLKLPTRLHKK